MTGKTILLILVLAGGAALGLLLQVYGYEATWQLWNIPTMSPHFADVRAITGGAESYRLGFDPLVDNPADPWGRPMDYPRIWELLFKLGIDRGDTTLIGLIMIALFVAGLWMFVDRIDGRTALFMAAAIFSPAVLLGIERANNDLLIFFLMASALVLLRRSDIMAAGMILLGSVLMFFPVFGLTCLMGRSRRRFLVLGGTGLALVLAYMAVTFKDLLLIQDSALRGTTISYGFNVIHTSVRDYFGSPTTGTLLAICSLIVVALLWFVTLRTRSRRLQLGRPSSRQHLDAFRLGAAIYIGTFLIGNNWDYRLMFLLFTIPQLAEWSREVHPLASLTARVTLTAVMASLWLQFLFRFAHLVPYGGHLAFALDELANWTVLAGMLFLLARTFPGWYSGPDLAPGAGQRTIGT